MSATTGVAPYPWRYQGWCDICKDGLNSRSRADADEWASDHNRKRHPSGVKGTA